MRLKNIENFKKIVIYTAIFGGKDHLIEPKFIPQNCDFVCFTDQDFTSDVWEIRKVAPISTDPVRAAKIYKILPHKFFPNYEYSVWVDGNLMVRGNVNELIKTYLTPGISNGAHVAIFDHNKLRRRFAKVFWIRDKQECYDCIYEEADMLMRMEKEGNYKDDSTLIKEQMATYKKAGYPEHNGLVSSMVVVRKHNEPDVVRVDEDWWKEIQNHSRRDQLSFNYVAWKNNLNFVYIKGDSRRNKYVLHTQHKIKDSFR